MTDGNFGTYEPVAIPISTVTCTHRIPISIFGIFVFPFPWESHGNEYPIPMHIFSVITAEIPKLPQLDPYYAN